MALTSVNGSLERTGKGQLYLVSAPVADPGASIALRITGYFNLFYAAGTMKGTPTVSPWCNMDASGLSIKAKQNTVEYDPNDGSKHPVGIIDCDMSGEFTFADVDPAHLADAFSCTTEEIITIAASTGKGARSQALLGGQSVFNKLTAMYRMPSGLGIAGEYDHFLFPRVIISPDADLKLSKKDMVTVKLKFTALNDIWLKNNAGFGEQCIADLTTAVGV